VHTGFWWGNPRETDHLEDWGIILKWIFKTWNGGMDWIDLAHDRDGWQVPVRAAMKLQVPQNTGNFVTS